MKRLFSLLVMGKKIAFSFYRTLERLFLFISMRKQNAGNLAFEFV